jgi:hypothetical protein
MLNYKFLILQGQFCHVMNLVCVVLSAVLKLTTKRKPVRTIFCCSFSFIFYGFVYYRILRCYHKESSPLITLLSNLIVFWYVRVNYVCLVFVMCVLLRLGELYYWII